MDELDYKNAERNFTEILKFDVDYKNAKSLKDIAYVEPILSMLSNSMKMKTCEVHTITLHWC